MDVFRFSLSSYEDEKKQSDSQSVMSKRHTLDIITEGKESAYIADCVNESSTPTSVPFMKNRYGPVSQDFYIQEKS